MQALPETIAANTQAFLGAVASDETCKPSAIGLRLTREAGLARLPAAYDLWARRTADGQLFRKSAASLMVFTRQQARIP